MERNQEMVSIYKCSDLKTSFLILTSESTTASSSSSEAPTSTSSTSEATLKRKPLLNNDSLSFSDKL